MSLPARILCRAGCGGIGDPELGDVCVDCHGDQVAKRRERELQQFVASRRPGQEPLAASAFQSLPETAPPSGHQGPPAINHLQALEAFLDRPRERDASVIAREQQFLARELEVRETSRQQLRKYMIASDDDDAGDAVDPTDWSRYQCGGLRDVPRHDVDEATELAAQRTLFCAWRKRSVRRRTETRRQLRLTTSATAKPLSASHRRETFTAALQGLAPVLATTARKATALLLLSSRAKKPTGAQPAAS